MSRPLSSIEYSNWLIDQVVSTAFTMVAQVSGILTEPVLRQALDILQEKFPPLKWRIKEGKPPEFVSEGVPKIPLRILERKDEQHWIDEAEKEIYEQFSWLEGPLVRVVQLASPDRKKCDLLVTFCHVASDALSGVMVVRELLSIADKLSRGIMITPPTTLPEPLPSNDLIRKDLNFEPYPLNEESIKARKSEILHGDQVTPPEKRVTRIIQKVIPEEETQKLVARCKMENTSVHAIICAAFFQVVVEQIRKQPGVPQKGPLMISCTTPVDIRHHFIKPVEEDIGYYISFAMHYQRIDENAPIWPAAREIKAAIQTEIKSGKDVEEIFSVGEFWKQYPTLVDMVRAINQSYPPVVVTNLGRIDIPEKYGDMELESIHVCGAMNCATRSGLLIGTSTFRNRLIMNFHYSEPYISRERAIITAESTMKRLKEAIQ